jgi:hypothetical protein
MIVCVSIAYVRIIQEAVVRQEGTIARLLADDKGTRFKIAFGMPTLAHEGTFHASPILSISPLLIQLHVTTKRMP